MCSIRQACCATLFALLTVGGICPAQDDPQLLAPEAFYALKAKLGGKLNDPLMLGAAEQLAKEGLHKVQNDIERFCADQPDHNYPQHINQLVVTDKPYMLPGFYANPFTAGSASDLDAREVPFGWSESAPGNFSYLQMYNAAGAVQGYVLVLYGRSRESGTDITGDGVPDGVVFSIGSWLPTIDPLSPGFVFYSGGQAVKLSMKQG